MAQVLVVTSGKGGVGKTTSTAALGAALAQEGERVVVVDFDVAVVPSVYADPLPRAVIESMASCYRSSAGPLIHSSNYCKENARVAICDLVAH